MQPKDTIIRNTWKRISILAICVCLSFHMKAQYNGYALSSAGIRIYDASASVLSEINTIPNKENRIVQFGSGISQTDFENICSKLKWIQKISIENAEDAIDNLSCLKKLKNLSCIRIKNCASTEPLSLTPIKDIETLKELTIIKTLVSDVDTLRELENLEIISFAHSPLSSIGFLSEMKQLKKLCLAGNCHTFTNYDTLAKLNMLTDLDISENPQATSDNLDVFSDVTTLLRVNVSDCPNLNSLLFLYSSVARLQECYATNCTNVGNFDILTRASKLKKVDISHSSAKNVSFLKNKTYLKDIRISHTQVASIAEIVDCSELERLDISFTNVSDISALSGKSKIKRLNISNTPITDISALNQCFALTDLNCSDTHIENIESLNNCEKLTKINIGNTEIRNLRPLYAAKKITSIIMDKDVPQVHREALQRRSPLIVIDYTQTENLESLSE